MPRRTPGRPLGAVAVAAAVAGALIAPAVAAPTPHPTHLPHLTHLTGPLPSQRHARTQAALDAVVRGGVPGATARAEDAHGAWHGTAGVGDLATQRPRGAHDRFRAGSVTKTFVATVLLQLEAEGALDLDDPVGTHLPGVVRGHGHDGGRVTVRQLLNHTSGLYDYAEDPGIQRAYRTPRFTAHRHRTWTPGQLVALAMRHRPHFAPGTAWRYSNTNYVVAGMLIERTTGRPYAEEIRRRIIAPLKLRSTSVPGTASRLPPPSSRAYARLSGGAHGLPYDVTEMNPSLAGAAGALVTDTADLNRFYAALLRGDLLPERQRTALLTTVPTGREATGGGRYGLGLLRIELPCGAVLWGHGGGIHGSLTLAVTTPRGEHSLALNVNGDWGGGPGRVLNAEYCHA
ncbi:serine hydrolase domain-containing protein [Streptomyces sp. G45]|uniref:serine hydrolase domain-containing protein n=1 Tax=Streptomyces sp. G45 TaxID=3406627 RepID=UPI003C1C29A6